MPNFINYFTKETRKSYNIFIWIKDTDEGHAFISHEQFCVWLENRDIKSFRYYRKDI
jgi:hypothetical protein